MTRQFEKRISFLVMTLLVLLSFAMAVASAYSPWLAHSNTEVKPSHLMQRTVAFVNKQASCVRQVTVSVPPSLTVTETLTVVVNHLNHNNCEHVTAAVVVTSSRRTLLNEAPSTTSVYNLNHLAIGKIHVYVVVAAPFAFPRAIEKIVDVTVPPTAISTPVNNPTIPVASMVSGMQYFTQIYTEDCETASLEMALYHEGIHATQNALLNLEGSQTQPPVMSNGAIVRWGDPYVNFVGNYNASQSNATGYGTYYPVIARVATTMGGNVLWSGAGLSFTEMKTYLSNNHPIIVWVDDTNNEVFIHSPLSYWTAWDGRSVPYPTMGNEHCVVVAGYDGNNVLIYNPLPGKGVQWVSDSVFLSTFSTFNNMAVVLN